MCDRVVGGRRGVAEWTDRAEEGAVDICPVKGLYGRDETDQPYHSGSEGREVPGYTRGPCLSGSVKN